MKKISEIYDIEKEDLVKNILSTFLIFAAIFLNYILLKNLIVS